MRFVFFGTPEFAVAVLGKLIAVGFLPAAVVCNPDRPVGRKHVIAPPPVKLLILKHETRNMAVLQPEKLDAVFRFQVSDFKPDFAVVAAYAKIIPKEILDIPRLGTIGVHPSLLPKYRGATPIQSAILNGEGETGVTLFLLDEKMDHGPMLAQKGLRAGSKKYGELLLELAELGGDLLVETIPKFLAGEITPQDQDHSQATYTKKFTTDDGFVDEKDVLEAESGAHSEKARTIERKIRALNPEPGVWTFRNGKRTKLLGAEIRDNRLCLTKIQEEGGVPRSL